MIDLFLDWCEKNRAGRTYDWYRERLQSFVDSVAASLTVAQLKPYHVQQWVDGKVAWADGMKRGAVTAVQRRVQLGREVRPPFRLAGRSRGEAARGQAGGHHHARPVPEDSGPV